MVRNILSKYLNGSSILVSGLLLTVFSFLLTGCFEDNTDETALQGQEAFNKQLEIDTLLIEQYLVDNNITNVKKTAGVIWYTEQTVGVGAQAQVGNRVKVNYALSLLNGTALESGPYIFTLGSSGRDGAIPGFDLGVRTMKVGGKSRFYIPSGLAYGTTGSGTKIAPNTILIFDIELLEAL